MISFTYCVSRYNDRTALSVFVSLHISHPAARWPLMWDKGLSRDREGSYLNTTLVAAVMACRAESYTRKSTSTSMVGEPKGPRVAGRGTTGRGGRLAHRRRSGGKSPPYPRALDPRTPDPRARHRDRILGHMARSRATRRRRTCHCRAQSRDRGDCPEEHGEDR